MSYNQIPIDANGFVTTTTTSNGDVVDLVNSNATPLLANASFVGSWVNTLNYAQIVVSTFTDQVGSLNVHFSTDSINVDHYHVYPILANIGENMQTHTHSKFYRITYTNGTIAQNAFRLQSILRPIAAVGTILELDDVPSAYDDGLLTKSVLVGQNTQSNQYVNVKATPDGGLAVNQNTATDPLNSSTANLISGGTFVGVGVQDLAYTGVQYNLSTDQNCIVFIDQSSNGVNWDIVDRFEYYASGGGNGQTVQLVALYYRIRVVNVGAVATTFFRLQTIAVPFINPLPRSLDSEGLLKVGVYSVTDESNFSQSFSPFGEEVAVPVTRLCGAAFHDAIIDPNIWTANIGTGGVIGGSGGQATLFTGTTANNLSYLTSVYSARYVSGRTNKFRTVVQLPDTGVINNTRRWGAFSGPGGDGAFIELAGTTLRFVTRKAGVDSPVPSGTFNGEYGSYYTLDTTAHLYDITYTPTNIYFYIDNALYHVVNANTTPWTTSTTYPVRFENFNSNAATANVSMNVRNGYIQALGAVFNQPISKYIGAAGTTTVKQSSGNLQGIILSGVASGASVTLYDNTVGSGTILWSSGTLTLGSQTNNFPFEIDFKGMQYNVGLTVVIVGTVLVTIMYE